MKHGYSFNSLKDIKLPSIPTNHVSHQNESSISQDNMHKSPLPPKPPQPPVSRGHSHRILSQSSLTIQQINTPITPLSPELPNDVTYLYGDHQEQNDYWRQLNDAYPNSVRPLTEHNLELLSKNADNVEPRILEWLRSLELVNYNLSPVAVYPDHTHAPRRKEPRSAVSHLIWQTMNTHEKS